MLVNIKYNNIKLVVVIMIAMIMIITVVNKYTAYCTVTYKFWYCDVCH